jgi:hypothetical protein
VPVAGNTIREEWLYLDGSGAPKSGMVSPADVTLSLFRSVGGGAFASSGETVTWAAIAGQPGYYDISYTPTGQGLYKLFLVELNVDSGGRRWAFTQEVLAAGAVFLPSFSSAYCAETDVERWTQLAFSATSKPTSTQVAAFAQSRASEIGGMMAAVSWSISPTDGSVAPGSIALDMLREANAIGAAADAYLAKFIDIDPAQTQKAVALLEEYQRRLDRLSAYGKTVASVTQGYIATPMTSGEVTPADEIAITDAGLSTAIAMDQEF